MDVNKRRASTGAEGMFLSPGAQRAPARGAELLRQGSPTDDCRTRIPSPHGARGEVLSGEMASEAVDVDADAPGRCNEGRGLAHGSHSFFWRVRHRVSNTLCEPCASSSTQLSALIRCGFERE